MKRILTALTGLFLFALNLSAGTIPISGTIRLANGNLMNGRVRFILSYSVARDTSANNLVVAQNVEFPVANGVLPTTARITPNDVLQPSNTFYTTQYLSSTGTVIAQNVFYIQGTSFNIGTATPTPLTTSNISFVVDSTLLNFTQAGTGAVARTVQAKEREVFSVTDFGADPTGAAYSTTAIRAACAAAIAASSTSSSGSGVIGGTAPTLYFPYGKYKMAGTACNSVNNYLAIEGQDHPIVEMDAGATFLTGVTNSLTMSNMTVRGGATVVATATGNLEATFVFNNNDFYQQTGPVIVNNMQSGNWQFNDGYFSDYTLTGQALVSTGGFFTFNQTRMTMSATLTAFDILNTALTLNQVVGITGHPLRSWITLRDGTFTHATVINSRLADDTGSATTATFENYATATNTLNTGGTNGLIVRDSFISGAGPLIWLYAIPNEIDITGTEGLGNVLPVKVDTSIAAANLATIGLYPYTTRYRINGNSLNFGTLFSADSPTIAANGLPLLSDRPLLSSRPSTADLQYQSAGNTGSYTGSFSQTNVTATTPNDDFGVAMYTFTATANDATATRTYSTALNGLAAGVYTAVFDLEVTTNHTVHAILQASNVVNNSFTLTKGKHSVPVPFYYDGGASQSIVFQADHMPNTAVIQMHRWRIFKGRFATPGLRMELDGTAAPTTGQWYRGDRVYNTGQSQPGVADYWTCIVAGSPGTWAANKAAGSFTMAAGAPTKVVTDANWLNSTAVSSVVFTPNSATATAMQGSAQNIYIVAGTTGVSFTVQTGNGTNAAGTEIFNYVIVN